RIDLQFLQYKQEHQRILIFTLQFHSRVHPTGESDYQHKYYRQPNHKSQTESSGERIIGEKTTEIRNESRHYASKEKKSGSIAYLTISLF
ncbi:MAG: hypothetical protein V3U07_07700, partial [Nitrospirales bacterium]